MKNEKNIETVIKEKFAERQFDIEQAWIDSMSDSLDEFNEKRRKKRIIFWWFLVGGILLGATFVSKQLLFSSDQTNLKYTNAEQITHSQTNERLTEEKFSTSDAQTANYETVHSEEATTIISESKGISQPTPTEKMLNEESIPSSSMGAIKRLLPKTEKELNPLPKEPNVIYVNPLIPFTPDHNTEYRNEKNTLIDTLPLKGPKQIAFPSGKHPISLQERKEKAPDMNEPSKWALGFTTGPSFTTRSLMLPTNDAYANARKGFEKGRINWNADLEISRKLGRFNVSSGVSLASLGENVQYEAIETTTNGLVNSITDASYWDYDSTFIQGQWVIDDSTWTPDFDTIQVPGIVTVYDSSILAANGKTQYSYFEIPVGIGFGLIEHKRLQLSASVGLSIGFRIKQKGNYLMNGGGITSAQSAKMTLSSRYSLDFKYRLDEKFSLGISPTFKINHMNFSDLEETQRRYSSWGLKIGWFMDL